MIACCPDNKVNLCYSNFNLKCQRVSVLLHFKTYKEDWSFHSFQTISFINRSETRALKFSQNRKVISDLTFFAN
jgi:hypothetical protein